MYNEGYANGGGSSASSCMNVVDLMFVQGECNKLA